MRSTRSLQSRRSILSAFVPRLSHFWSICTLLTRPVTDHTGVASLIDVIERQLLPNLDSGLMSPFEGLREVTRSDIACQIESGRIQLARAVDDSALA